MRIRLRKAVAIHPTTQYEIGWGNPKYDVSDGYFLNILAGFRGVGIILLHAYIQLRFKHALCGYKLTINNTLCWSNLKRERSFD